jgi:hypothetical protein
MPSKEIKNHQKNFRIIVKEMITLIFGISVIIIVTTYSKIIFKAYLEDLNDSQTDSQ